MGDYDGIHTIYPSVTGVLSELLRTAMIASRGSGFWSLTSPLSRRGSLRIAGEEDTMEELRGEGLIYEKTASMMFHVPKDDIRKGGSREDLRKGKIATLACGYGGGINSLLAFGVDKMGMTNEEMAQTVDLWRKANPRIVQMRLSGEGHEQASRQSRNDRGQAGRHPYSAGMAATSSCGFPAGGRWRTANRATRRACGRTGRTISYMGIEQKTRKWK